MVFCDLFTVCVLILTVIVSDVYDCWHSLLTLFNFSRNVMFNFMTFLHCDFQTRKVKENLVWREYVRLNFRLLLH